MDMRHIHGDRHIVAITSRTFRGQKSINEMYLPMDMTHIYRYHIQLLLLLQSFFLLSRLTPLLSLCSLFISNLLI